jgi:GT2 family glycosyltransferase
MSVVTKIVKEGTVVTNRTAFTICALFYGNYPDIAARCIDSILQLPKDRYILKLGLNAVSDEVKTLLRKKVTSTNACEVYISNTNIGKYRLMSEMFKQDILSTKYVMWFDDDSYITTPTDTWLDNIEAVMQTSDMCGQLMSTNLQGGQPYWIVRQPWYKNKPLITKNGKPIVPQFAVGGWWCVKTDVLYDVGWPPQELVHTGGDYMLGEALRQNDYTLVDFKEGVVINANKTAVNGSSPRRGLTLRPVGIDYEPTLTEVAHDATRSIPLPLLDYTNV